MARRCWRWCSRGHRRARGTRACGRCRTPPAAARGDRATGHARLLTDRARPVRGWAPARPLRRAPAGIHRPLSSPALAWRVRLCHSASVLHSSSHSYLQGYRSFCASFSIVAYSEASRESARGTTSYYRRKLFSRMQHSVEDVCDVAYGIHGVFVVHALGADDADCAAALACHASWSRNEHQAGHFGGLVGEIEDHADAFLPGVDVGAQQLYEALLGFEGGEDFAEALAVLHAADCLAADKIRYAFYVDSAGGDVGLGDGFDPELLHGAEQHLILVTLLLQHAGDLGPA